MGDKKGGGDHVSHEVSGLGDCVEVIIWLHSNIVEDRNKHWFGEQRRMQEWPRVRKIRTAIDTSSTTSLTKNLSAPSTSRVII